MSKECIRFLGTLCTYIYIYIYISDNIYLMMNASPKAAGVSSSWKPVLCGRLERRCAMVVPLNGCDLVQTFAACGW